MKKDKGFSVTVAKRDLVKAASRVVGVAERRSTMPMLANVLLEIDAGQLRLSATDLYLGIAGSVPAEAATSGSVAIPAKDFLDRVKMMPDGPVQIAAPEAASTTIKAPGSARRFTLRGMPGEEFPPLPRPDEGAPTLTIDGNVLLELVALTIYAVSSDETRAHLNSALFEWEGDVVRMVATDGHRLAKIERTIEGRQAQASMLIPLKALHEIRKLCEDSKAAPVTIVSSASTIFFRVDDVSLSVKAVSAQFPPYNQVIPKTQEKVVRAPRAALADAVRAVAVAASDRTSGVKVALKKGLATVTSESHEGGNGLDEVAIDYDGPDMTIGMNAKLLLDALGALDEEEVTIGMNGELDPVTLRPSGDRKYVGVVMPMRV